MIVIQIKNVEQLVKKERGTFAARFGNLVTDLEVEVERMIVDQIMEAFEDQDVAAEIKIVGGVKETFHTL